jgi:nucleotide-binding universal stress UspA family protein
MEGKFKVILTLIDFTQASLHAAEEAALIAVKFDSELHLIHIGPDKKSGARITDNDNLKTDLLENVKKDLEKRFSVRITCFIYEGEFVDIVRKHVKIFSVGLVVMGARKRNWFKEIFIKNKKRLLIKYAGSEFLYVHCDSGTATFKKIVLPVGKFISKKKITIAYEFAKKFSSNIHLVALNKQENALDKKSAGSLIASYRYLRDITNMPIECNTIVGKNLADATMQYADVIGADLILIDEDAESDLKMALWKGKIFNHSMVTVMSVQSVPDRSKIKYRA